MLLPSLTTTALQFYANVGGCGFVQPTITAIGGVVQWFSSSLGPQCNANSLGMIAGALIIQILPNQNIQFLAQGGTLPVFGTGATLIFTKLQ